LAWNEKSKLVSLDQVLEMNFNEILDDVNFSKVRSYYKIIKFNSPDVIFICGDITGGGSCGHGYASSIVALLKIIEGLNITTSYISSNHDENIDVIKLDEISTDSKFVKRLTGNIDEVRGLKVIGLSYEQSKNVKSFQKLKTDVEIDFVISHCNQTNRLHLFDFNTEFTITGHYDFKVINPYGKTLISLYNDLPWMNYVIIDYSKTSSKFSYYIKEHTDFNWTFIKFAKLNGKLKNLETNYVHEKFHVNLYIPFITNNDYEKAIEYILKWKMENQDINSVDLKKLMNVEISPYQNISKSFIKSYIKAQ
jgi:hypothetical protein